MGLLIHSLFFQYECISNLHQTIKTKNPSFYFVLINSFNGITIIYIYLFLKELISLSMSIFKSTQISNPNVKSCEWIQVIIVLKLRLNRSGITRVQSLVDIILGQVLLTSRLDLGLVRDFFPWWTGGLRQKNSKRLLWPHLSRPLQAPFLSTSSHFKLYSRPKLYSVSISAMNNAFQSQKSQKKINTRFSINNYVWSL